MCKRNGGSTQDMRSVKQMLWFKTFYNRVIIKQWLIAEYACPVDYILCRGVKHLSKRLLWCETTFNLVMSSVLEFWREMYHIMAITPSSTLTCSCSVCLDSIYGLNRSVSNLFVKEKKKLWYPIIINIWCDSSKYWSGSLLTISITYWELMLSAWLDSMSSQNTTANNLLTDGWTLKLS